MNTAKRREEIARALAESDTPLSATALASRFSVSRQVVVGDIALLRAGGLAVLATPRGYVLESPVDAPQTLEKTIVCAHNEADMAEELYTIVDLGGAVLDVTVEHSVYGELCAPLRIFSRYDADLFLQKIRAPGVRPLCDLTGGVHLHRVRCADKTTFERIERALLDKKLLLPR
ncbi:MAG: transcription repressor NadR [Clostridia bacterium]|nr:transcription repressor NadR [Clostridia bacterium]